MEENFLVSCNSAEKELRYDSLTSRYGIKIVK